MEKAKNKLPAYFIFLAALVIAAAIIESSVSYAVPVPLGVDGIIYELDGVSQVRSGIDFSVTNNNNGKTVSGKTGHGSSGRYSAPISGNAGDSITIKAWNKYNQVNATMQLAGVMRGINLFLNMTYPPHGPNITSYPSESALEDSAYTYQIIAFDENEEDILDYKIVEGAESMSIDSQSGLLSWVPSNEDVGAHSIKIQVSDGVFLSNQSFSVSVENTNDEVIINSIPIDYAKVGHQYSYSIVATDADNDELEYYLQIYPAGMTISKNGIIEWKPKGNNKGRNNVIVNVTDGVFTASQQFYIDVESEPEQQNTPARAPSGEGGGSGGGGGGGGGSGGGAAPASIVNSFEKEKKTLVAVKLPVSGAQVKIDELAARPNDAKKLDRRVYRYLIIENVKQVKINSTEGAEINFAVDRKWLENQQINPADIIMTRYHNNSWQDLITSNISSDNETVHYTAKTPGFSYFAISVKDGAQIPPFTLGQASKIESPFRVFGVIYMFGKIFQADEGKTVGFENMITGEKTYSSTGIGPGSGAYYALVYGTAGDTIRLTIEGAENYFDFELKDYEGLNFMMNARESKFSRTGGDFLTEMLQDSVLMASLAAILIGLILIRLSRTTFRKI